MNFSKVKLILFAVFFICTIVTMFIVFQDNDLVDGFYFVIFYLVFLFVFGIFLLISSLLRIKKLEVGERKSRVKRFLYLFLFYSVAGIGVHYVFMHDFSFQFMIIAFALAFGMSFMDLGFLKKEE